MELLAPASFGDLLRSFRKRLRLTQQELAEKLSLHRNTIGAWEQGSFLPASRGIVLELAGQLHLDDIETRQLLDASLTTQVPSWNVPYLRNPFFTGRTAILDTLHQHLAPQKGATFTRSHALYGLGGMGKTQIAVEYAYRHALLYDAIFWIGAENRESIIASFLTIAQLLKLPASQETNPELIVDIIRHWLSTHTAWLLIWDNLEDLEMLPMYLPPTHHGSILITTLHQALGTLAQGIELHAMEPDEGMLFLLRRAKVLGPHTTREQVQEITRRCPAEYAAAEAIVIDLGGLPLALDQAGAYLEETGCGLLNYQRRFLHQRAHLLTRRGTPCGNHPQSVTATLALATRQVTCNPLAVDLLRLCAFLYAEGIPEELFGSAYAATYTTSVDVAHLDLAIATLRRFSLIQRHPEREVLSLHRLVQIVVQEEMNEQERSSFQRRVIRLLLDAFPTMTPTTWTQCERLLPHILACAATIGEAEESSDVADLLCKAADYLLERALYKEAEPLYQRVLRIRTRIFGDHHLESAQVLNNLAILAYRQGKFAEAEHLYRQALDIREQRLGPEHPEVASSLNNLAILSYEQAKYEQAEPLYLRALHIWEQASGPTHPRLAQVLYGLGNLYSEQAKYEQAEPLYLRALSIAEQAMGPDHPNVAYPLNGLAFLYYEQARDEEAEVLYQRALRIREQALGPEHPLLASVLTNLAHIFFRQGKFKEAQHLYQRALCIREQALGPDHAEVASPLHGLAMLYTELGRYEQAEALFHRTLCIREHQFGQHPDTARSLLGLGILSEKQRKYACARESIQRACSMFTDCFGTHHPETERALQIYHRLPQPEKNTAEEADEKTDGQEPSRDRQKKTLCSPTPAEASECQKEALDTFLAARCTLHPLAWSYARDLWQTYELWIEESQQHFSLSRRAFTNLLKAYGCRADRTKTSRIWRGIAVITVEAVTQGDGR